MTLEIPTERTGVILRQLTPQDAEAYFLAVDANREHLSQFGDRTARQYPSLEAVERSIRTPLDFTKTRLGIWVDSDTFVGTINLTPQDVHITEIGYWVDSRHAGNGYASLACTALSNFALLEQGFESVIGVAHKDNATSLRVLEKSGFRPLSLQIPIGPDKVLRVKEEPSHLAV